MKLLTILVMLALVSGCGLLGTRGEECGGEDCDTPTLLDNTPARATWYCYADDGRWDCSRQARPQPEV